MAWTRKLYLSLFLSEYLPATLRIWGKHFKYGIDKKKMITMLISAMIIICVAYLRSTYNEIDVIIGRPSFASVVPCKETAIWRVFASCSFNYAYTIPTHDLSSSFTSFALQQWTETEHVASLLRAVHPRSDSRYRQGFSFSPKARPNLASTGYCPFVSRGEADELWGWTITTIECCCWEYLELYRHSGIYLQDLRLNSANLCRSDEQYLL